MAPSTDSAQELAFGVDGARLVALARQRRRRGSALLALGLFGLLFGTFWLFWGVVVMLTGVGLRNAVLVTVFGGLGPTLGSAILAWAGISRRGDADLLDELAMIAGSRADVTVTEVTTWTGRDAPRVAAVLRWATGRGAASPVGAAAPRPALATAPLDRDKLRAFRRARLRRGLLLGVAAIAVLGFAAIWIVVGVAGIATGEVLVGIVLLVPGGLFPLLGASALAWRAASNVRRSSRISRLVTVVASRELGGLDALAQALGTTPAEARATALEAAELGLIGLERSSHLVGATGSAVAPPPQVEPARAEGGLGAWLGRTLEGRWRVEALLAHGGMGAVFRARELATGQPYALKILLPDAQWTPDALRRFEREATAAGGLGHPGIARVHAFGHAEDGAAFLVMDLLEGETLESRLQRRGTLPWEDALEIAREVGDALAAAHDAGLLHRDVKPANVFLARGAAGERAVLLDFGLVKRIDESAASRMTTSGVVAGTPLYMSPEQARGEQLDVRSDLYGLAVVLYEMIAGVPPFFDKSVAEVYARLLREAAPRLGRTAPGACPEQLDQILARALATSPAERPATVRELLAALGSIPRASRSLAG